MKYTLYRGILLLFSGSLLMISCKKTYEFEASGRVYNKITGEPIEGSMMTLIDGLETNDFLLPSDGGSNENVTYTDVNGNYSVKLKTKESWHAVLWASKEGYQYRKQVGGTEQAYEMFGEGQHIIDLPMEGTAYFNPAFLKRSSPVEVEDELIISLFQYDKLNEVHITWSDMRYMGVGPFYLSTNQYAIPNMKGDRYLRYKLEWTNDGVWQSKIDSVYLPTSLEVYRDTIYY